MQGVIAEYERAKIVERTRRGRLHKMRSGEIPPFVEAPYGYTLVRSAAAPRGIVVVNEVEAVHVRAMFRWVLEEGLSARHIARRLNEQGVRPRRSKAWGSATVHALLTNPAYAGMAAVGKIESAEP